MPRHLRIGVFGPYSSKNLGDTATQMAVMAQLRARLGHVEFIGICFDPADAARTHGVIAADMTGASGRLYLPGETAPAAPGASSLGARLRRHLPYRVALLWKRARSTWNIARIVRKIDVLVISGGGQLDDFWGGPWGRPYELLAWTRLCRLFGRKVAIFGTGVDNLSTDLGASMIARAVRLAHYRMFRDAQTVQALRAWGIEEPGATGPDPAFSLDTDAMTASATRSEHGPVVVLCPISESAWRREPEARYPAYLEGLAEVAITLARNGARVVISNSQTAMDIPVLEALASRIRSLSPPPGVDVEVRPSATVAEFCALAAAADLVIASRLHGVILPMVVGTPVVAISYMPKVTLLMQEAGMEDKCVALTQATASRVATMASDVLANRAAQRKRIAALNGNYRSALARHYDDLVAAVCRDPGPPRIH